MVAEDSGMAQSKRQSEQRSDGMQSNPPKLHPTRRKVLVGAAELCPVGSWTTSSQVRQRAGISQQLLNRHLRALESDGLVSLENPGPGRPLSVQVTSAGLQVLGLGGPQADDTPGQDTPPTPAQPAQADTVGQRPVIRLNKRVYLFLERLYNVLIPFMRDLDRGNYFHAAGPAMNKRPVKDALHDALSPFLAGVGPVEFDQIVTRLVETQPKLEAQPLAQQQRQARSVSLASGQGPLVLTPLEAALEDRLAGSMNQAYQGMAWYQRTRQMSDEWDRTRRRRLGLFRTMFSSFDPRWQRLDWADFNQARRQADYCGANYAEWVAKQFDQLSPDGQTEVMPGELYGQRALKAYRECCAE